MNREYYNVIILLFVYITKVHFIYLGQNIVFCPFQFSNSPFSKPSNCISQWLQGTCEEFP